MEPGDAVCQGRWPWIRRLRFSSLGVKFSGAVSHAYIVLRTACTPDGSCAFFPAVIRSLFSKSPRLA